MDEWQARAGDLSVSIRPGVGGAIAALTWRGRDVFRPATAEGVATGEPRGMACFPMVPYASRLSGGRVRHGDVDAVLPGNMPPEPLPLHGVGWWRAWVAHAPDPETLVMTLDHPGDADWPWAFEARQTIRLFPEADRVEITLAIGNRDDRSFPVSLGLHPYFPIAQAELRAGVRDLWSTDAVGIPTGRVRPGTLDAMGRGVAVADLTIDNCMEGWDGVAHLAWPGLEGWDGRASLELAGMAVAMTGAARGPKGPIACTRLQLYVPAGHDFFCLEPVTARTDAFNAADPEEEGAVILEPGEAMELTMGLSFEAA